MISGIVDAWITSSLIVAQGIALAVPAQPSSVDACHVVQQREQFTAFIPCQAQFVSTHILPILNLT